MLCLRETKYFYTQNCCRNKEKPIKSSLSRKLKLKTKNQEK